MRAEVHVDREGSSVRLAAFGAFLCACLIGIVALAVSDAWRAGFSGADEPAHFLNSWFLSLYARDALGADPMAFATEFYLHYPKISIGHWPPAYYALLSPFFLVLPATSQTALALNLVLSSAPAVLAAVLVHRLFGTLGALIAGLLTALTPVALEGYAFFMLDQAVAAAALGATLLRIGHAERPAWWKPIGFALFAAAAILIKGNGWLLLFVPPIHILLTWRWDLLRSPWPWAAAFLGGALVGPWYWLTAGISADGFNYAPGAAYAWQALSYNLAALEDNIGLPGLALAGWGAISGWRSRREAPGRWNVLAACGALLSATLLIQSLVPVDLDPRYMAPALPPLIALALVPLFSLAAGRWRVPFVAAAAMLFAFPGIAHLALRQPKIDLRLEEAAANVPARPAAWLIDGSSGAEGAFIAAMAVRDPELRSYAIRSSRLLAESDFMGSEYRLSLRRPEQVLQRLQELGIEGIVIARIGGKPAFPHSALLRAALLSPRSPYTLVSALPHRNRPGVTEIFRARSPMAINEPAIRGLGLPSKAQAVLP